MRTYLDQPLKAAVVRILSDLVKSDNVISLSELNLLDARFREFGIDDDDRKVSSGITLQDAFKLMKKAPLSAKNAVEGAMLDVAGADNECCRAEAMLITAFRYVVKGKGSKVYSMRFRNRPILDTQILYIENPSPGERRIGGDLLRDCHEQVSNIVEAAGFDLVYIPVIKNRLNRWDSIKGVGNLERVFRLISPTLAPGEASLVAERAKGLTTKSFYEDVLCSSEGLAMPLEVTRPSWIVRLCNSTLDGKGYANFMCFELDFDKETREERDAQIRLQMHRFVDDLNALQGSYTILVNRHKAVGEDFQYGGFYKVLFDVLLGKKRGGWRLHIYPGRAPKASVGGDAGMRCQMCISEEGRRFWIPLTGMDAALYVLILLMSLEGREGLNVTGYGRLQKLFETVYLSITTRDTDTAPDVTVPGTFRQVKHRVLKRLLLEKTVSEHGLSVDQDRNVLKIRTDISNIMIGEDVPLKESPLYGNFIRTLRNLS